MFFDGVRAIRSGRSDNHQSRDENPPVKYSEDVPGSDM